MFMNYDFNFNLKNMLVSFWLLNFGIPKTFMNEDLHQLNQLNVQLVLSLSYSCRLR